MFGDSVGPHIAVGLATTQRQGRNMNEIDSMSQPVRCRWCSGIYDLGAVQVTGRYSDCSVWKTPCCNNTADDRGETGWKSFADYERIEKGPRQLRVDEYGRVAFGGRFPWEGGS